MQQVEKASIAIVCLTLMYYQYVMWSLIEQHTNDFIRDQEDKERKDNAFQN
jgi:hypothetical protein